MVDESRGNWMALVSGRIYYPIHPRPEEVFIEDVAHALSNLCRYTGHVRRFYSVAEHCYYVSYLVPPEHALEGLLHDAAEAYLGDVARPLKLCLPDYAAIERRNELAIRERFGLPKDETPIVKQMDIAIFLEEVRQLKPASIVKRLHDARAINGVKEGTSPPVLPNNIGFPPEYAKRMFLDRFDELMIRPRDPEGRA